jgi:hypothetical protein
LPSALGVGLVIGLVTLISTIACFYGVPDVPHVGGKGDADAKTAIENYRVLADAHVERATKLFDVVVVKALLPVFTAILGYIFGSRKDGADVT